MIKYCVNVANLRNGQVAHSPIKTAFDEASAKNALNDIIDRLTRNPSVWEWFPIAPQFGSTEHLGDLLVTGKQLFSSVTISIAYLKD